MFLKKLHPSKEKRVTGQEPKIYGMSKCKREASLGRGDAQQMSNLVCPLVRDWWPLTLWMFKEYDKSWCCFCPSYLLCGATVLQASGSKTASPGRISLDSIPHYRTDLRIVDLKTLFAHCIVCLLDVSE